MFLSCLFMIILTIMVCVVTVLFIAINTAIFFLTF